MGKTPDSRRLERCKVVIIPPIQSLLFDKFPEPFDQIEIRGIGRKIQEFNVERGREVFDILAFLIPGIVEHKRDGNGQL